MTDLSEFQPRSGKPKPPKGWEPNLRWNDNGVGEITTGGLTDEPTEALWDELITDWGLDPSKVEIVKGSIQIRAWDSNLGNGEIQRLKYYRATIQNKEDAPDREDINQLLSKIIKRKPLKTAPRQGNRAFLILASDWQTGKGEGGGTPAMIERVIKAQDAALTRCKELVRSGRAIETVYIVGLGDLVEQCSGHYAMQAFQVDADRREQMKIVRRLLIRMVDLFVPLGVKIVLAAVAGNHGENRNSSGKAYTTWTDNDDLAVFEQVAEILEINPLRYGNVSVPSGAIADDLSLTLDIYGVPCGFAHGHQFAKAGNSQNRMESWLRGQVMGKQAIADAALLFSGHYHHFICSESTGRTVFQSPAMDGGSKWFTNQTGSSSQAGMLTMCVGDVYLRGWGDLAIL